MTSEERSGAVRHIRYLASEAMRCEGEVEKAAAYLEAAKRRASLAEHELHRAVDELSMEIVADDEAGEVTT